MTALECATTLTYKYIKMGFVEGEAHDRDTAAEEIEARLEALAKATGRTKAFYAREAILEYIDDLEDIYLAEQVLERVRRGEERTYTLDEVERDLGLAD